MDRLDDNIMQSARIVLAGVLKGDGDPDDILEKTARRRDMADDVVRTVGSMVNQALSARMTGAGVQEFRLVDPEGVVGRLHGSLDKAAGRKPGFGLPAGDRSFADFPMDKLASKDSPPPVDAVFQRVFAKTARKCVDRHTQLLTAANQNEIRKRAAFEKELDKLAGQVRRMGDSELHKFAQLTVNGYQGIGKAMLKMVETKTGLPVPRLEKTANTAVFPASPVYAQVGRVVETGVQYKKAQDTADIMHKYAAEVGGFAQGADEALARYMYGEGGKLQDPDTLERELDPDIRNMLKELDARNNLATLMLYDPDLKDQPMPAVVSAYNSAVSSIPELESNPAVLKSMVLQRVNAGNVTDVPQMAQEMKLREGLWKGLESMQARRKPAGEAAGGSVLGPVAMAFGPGKVIKSIKESGPGGKGGGSGDSGGKSGKSAKDNKSGKDGVPAKDLAEFVEKRYETFAGKWHDLWRDPANPAMAITKDEYEKGVDTDYLKELSEKFITGEPIEDPFDKKVLGYFLGRV